MSNGEAPYVNIMLDVCTYPS